MQLQCNTCGATYIDVQADGVQYFHACAPLSVAELKAGLANGTIALSKSQAAQYAAAQAAPANPAAPAGTPPAADAFLATLIVERPNKRDENIVVDPYSRAVTMKAAGLGVTELPAAG